jgi:transcriptional regulator with XRE-family HTH domain
MEWTHRLKRRRTELNLTQEVVAAHVGRTRGAVAQWEAAEPGRPFLPPKEMRKLAEVLQMPVDRLMWGDAMDGHIGDVSGDERALLLGYRELPADRKETLRRVLDGFLAGEGAKGAGRDPTRAR